VQFSFFRLRFHFEAAGPLQFPPGRSGNTIRGALGGILRKIACSPECSGNVHSADCAYSRIFEPRALTGGPSGFFERPRPFVLRTRHLDGRSFAPGQPFSFDVHLFDLKNPALPYFVSAFSRLAEEGLGAGRQPARLQSVEQIALDDSVAVRVWERERLLPLREPSTVALAAGNSPAAAALVRFVTPTELKHQNALVARPDFPVLFARIRDRISTLRALYGKGPLRIDFHAMSERASLVEMTRCNMVTEFTRRRSRRTGQVHPLAGFTGEAEYRGDLAEFLPYLRAARWTGVGRHTVWGQGELHLLE
jgi:hypothetical protein